MVAVLVVLLDMVWVVLVTRVVVDLLAAVLPAGAPGDDLVQRVRCGLLQLTEPVLAPVRRVVPSARVGPLTADGAVLAVLAIDVVLLTVVRG